MHALPTSVDHASFTVGEAGPSTGNAGGDAEGDGDAEGALHTTDCASPPTTQLVGNGVDHVGAPWHAELLKFSHAYADAPTHSVIAQDWFDTCAHCPRKSVLMLAAAAARGGHVSAAAKFETTTVPARGGGATYEPETHDDRLDVEPSAEKHPSGTELLAAAVVHDEEAYVSIMPYEEVLQAAWA